MRNRERVGWLCKQNLRIREIWNCLRRIFQLGLNSRLMMRGKWKRVSPRGNRLVDGRQNLSRTESVRGIFIRIIPRDQSHDHASMVHVQI